MFTSAVQHHNMQSARAVFRTTASCSWVVQHMQSSCAVFRITTSCSWAVQHMQNLLLLIHQNTLNSSYSSKSLWSQHWEDVVRQIAEACWWSSLVFLVISWSVNGPVLREQVDGIWESALETVLQLLHVYMHWYTQIPACTKMYMYTYILS